MPAKKKGSKTLKVMPQARPKGRRTQKAVTADKQRKAQHPGVRRSSSGKVYTERRANRSDSNRTKKL